MFVHKTKLTVVSQMKYNVFFFHMRFSRELMHYSEIISVEFIKTKTGAT